MYVLPATGTGLLAFGALSGSVVPLVLGVACLGISVYRFVRLKIGERRLN